MRSSLSLVSLLLWLFITLWAFGKKWSSQAIFLWKHQFALAYHKIFLLTKKISSFIIKSHQVKVIRNRRNFLLYFIKEHYWIIFANCSIKNREMIKKKITWLVRKINKTFGRKSFSTFGSILLTPLNTLKLLAAKCFINFLLGSWKIHFVLFQDFFTQKLVHIVQNCSLLL